MSTTLDCARRVSPTASGSSRHTLSGGAVDSTVILLERPVGNTAHAVGGLAGVEHGASDAVDALDVGDGGGGEGQKTEESGGDGELHFGIDLSGFVWAMVESVVELLTVGSEGRPHSGKK